MKVYCGACRKTAVEEKELPVCIGGRCPTGRDELTDADLRLIEIEELGATLAPYQLAPHICTEFGVDADDLRILSQIAPLANLLREKQREDHG